MVYESVAREQVKAENAATRVSRRIMERLDEIGMTARVFAGKLNHVGGWVSGLKQERYALGLDELDASAEALGMTPSELVRKDAHELWELRPTEMRLIRAVRELPPVMRDQLVLMAEFMMGVAPKEIDFLLAYRELTPDEQKKIQYLVDVQRVTRKVAPSTKERERQPGTAGRATPATRPDREQRRGQRWISNEDETPPTA